MAMGEPTFIDLFAAPGGLSLGFEMAGFRCLAAVDIDERAMLTFKHNFPEAAVIVEDITRLKSEDLLGRAGVKASDVDVIIGGPPCQGFSTVGRVKIASLVREGIWSLSNSHPRFIDDPRNVLYREFVRMVADIKPKAFVMENVPGMMSYRNGEIVRQILEDFSRIGYRTEARVLNSVCFGVPQMRKRIFFVGTRLRDAEILWPEPECMEPEEAVVRLDAFFGGSGIKRPVTVWEAIGDLPEPVQGRPGLADRPIEYDRPPFSDYQRWARESSDRVHNHVTRQHSERDVLVFSMMQEGMWWKDLPEEIRKLYGYRDDIFHDKMKRIRSDRPSWTVVAHLYKDGYMYIHPKQPRTITVREAARLQSFPDRFIFRGSRTDQFRQVGNAVPPLLARAVAECVRRMLEASE
ncbi:MAG: DNA cytosine methyltransferase [Thermofilum sp.]